MITAKSLWCIFILVIWSSVVISQVVPNGDFELGTSGLAFLREINPRVNPECVFENPTIDKGIYGRSLKISSSFGEVTKMILPEFCLSPGAEYEISFYLKSSVPLAVSAGISSVDRKLLHPFGDSVGYQAKCSNEWKRFSFRVVTKKPWWNPYYSFELRTPAIKADIWVDRIQIQRVCDGLPEPADTVEINTSLTAGVPYIIKDKEAVSVPVIFRIANSSKKDKKLLFRLYAEDSMREKIVYSTRQTVLAKAESSIEMPLCMSLREYGSFILKAECLSGDDSSFFHIPGLINIIGKYERKAVDPRKEFCVGVNGSPFIHKTDASGKPLVMAFGMSPDQSMKMVADTGIRILRIWGSGPCYSWKTIEKQEGAFDFSIMEKQLKMAHANGMTLLVPIGEEFYEKNYFPDWVKAKSLPVKRKGERGQLDCLPPLRVWGNFVEKFAEKFRGNSSLIYEFFNEPNLRMHPVDYVEYLSQTRQSMKKGDPDSWLIGCCATSDFGSGLEQFLDACFKLGALKLCDAVSFHPYAAWDLWNPYLQSRCFTVGADEQIQQLKTMLKQYGDEKKQLWNTELYYLRGGVPQELGGWVESGRFAPWNLSRRTLIDLGEGVSQSIAIHFDGLRNHYYSPDQTLKHSDGNLNGAMVALNALARIFEGAKPEGRVHWGFDTVCYTYSNKGRQLAAFWYFGDFRQRDLAISLSESDMGKIEVMDFYGNPLEIKNGRIVFNQKPIFVASREKQSSAEWKKMLQSWQIIDDVESMVKPGKQIRIFSGNTGKTAQIALRNTTDKKASGMLLLLDKNSVVAGYAGYEIGPRAESSINIELDRMSDGTEYTVSLKENGREQQFSFPCQAVYAKIIEVKDKPGTALNLDLSGNATLKAWHNSKNLCIEIKVKDDTPFYYGNDEPWRSDCVEAFFDLRPEYLSAANPEQPTPYVYRTFSTVARSDGPMNTGNGLSICSIKSSKSSGSYTLVYEIDKKNIGATGRIGVEFKIQNYSRDGKLQQVMTWNSSRTDTYRNRLNLGIMKLDDRPDDSGSFLRNPDFDKLNSAGVPEHWLRETRHYDRRDIKPISFTNGTARLNGGDDRSSVYLIQRKIPLMTGRYELSFALRKTKEASGEVYVEWIRNDGKFVKQKIELDLQSDTWKTYSGSFDFSDNEIKVLPYFVATIQGKGSVWIKNIRLTNVPADKKP